MDVVLYLQVSVVGLSEETTAAPSVGKLAQEESQQVVSFDSILHAQG